MKPLLLLLVSSVFVGQLNAQEAQTPEKETQSASRNIYDLMYLPVQGTFAGSTTYKGTSNTTNYQYISRDFLEIESNTKSIEQEFGYAFSSNTFVGFGVGYQFDSETKSKYGPGSNINGSQSTSVKEKGMEDPSVFLRHRFSESETSGSDVDFIFRFSPKTGNAKSATTTLEGNAKRGASQLTLGIDLGKKTADNAWNVDFSYLMTTKATDEDAANSSNKITADPYGVLMAEFKYQWVFNPKFVINLGAGLGVVGKREQELPAAEVKNKYDSAGLFTIVADLIFNPTPDVSLQFGIIGVGTGEHDFVQTDTSTGTTTTLAVEENSSGEVTLSAHYQF